MSSIQGAPPPPQIQTDNPAFVPALLVIDMQNDFVSGSLAVPDAASIIDSVNALLDLPQWKVKIGTRDFHPKDHVSFAVTHGRPVLSKMMIYHPQDEKQELGIQQVMWPVHCVAHTSGAEFVKGLHKAAFDVVVHKGTHAHIEAYSAFKDIWGKSTTELPLVLEDLGVTDLFLVGLAGDYCVKYTAIDAVEFGYRTWLVTDAVKSVSEEEAALKEMVNKGVQVTTCKEVKERVAPEPRN